MYLPVNSQLRCKRIIFAFAGKVARRLLTNKSSWNNRILSYLSWNKSLNNQECTNNATGISESKSAKQSWKILRNLVVSNESLDDRCCHAFAPTRFFFFFLSFSLSKQIWGWRMRAEDRKKRKPAGRGRRRSGISRDREEKRRVLRETRSLEGDRRRKGEGEFERETSCRWRNWRRDDGE